MLFLNSILPETPTDSRTLKKRSLHSIRSDLFIGNRCLLGRTGRRGCAHTSSRLFMNHISHFLLLYSRFPLCVLQSKGKSSYQTPRQHMYHPGLKKEAFAKFLKNQCVSGGFCYLYFSLLNIKTSTSIATV